MADVTEKKLRLSTRQINARNAMILWIMKNEDFELSLKELEEILNNPVSYQQLSNIINNKE